MAWWDSRGEEGLPGSGREASRAYCGFVRHGAGHVSFACLLDSSQQGLVLGIWGLGVKQETSGSWEGRASSRVPFLLSFLTPQGTHGSASDSGWLCGRGGSGVLPHLSANLIPPRVEVGPSG